MLQQKEFFRDGINWQFFSGTEQSKYFDNEVFKNNRCEGVSYADFTKLRGCLKETVGIS